MSDTTLDDEALLRHLGASAALMDLQVEPAWREAVLGYFKGMAAAARLVEAFELPDEAEPAPVFSA